jgi:hypothetical protein
MTTTPNLSYLPPEILSSIIAFVPTKSSLCNLALCSSLFYSLTVPVLYAHVDLYSRHHRFKTLRPLTVLFLTKPTLAQHVRWFTLRDPYEYYDVQPSESYSEQSNLSKAEICDVEDVLKEAVFASGHSEKECKDWVWNVAQNQTDALLAILLPTMVRLEKLDLMLRQRYWQYFERMIRRGLAYEKPFDRQPLFTTLTDFMHMPSWGVPSTDGSYGQRLSGRDWTLEPMNMNYSMMFQYFPRIRSIFAHCITGKHRSDIQDFDDVYLPLTRISSSLTHLELKNSLVDERNLVAMLKVPEALSTFIYEISVTRDLDWVSKASPVDILFALAPQYHSLENLWLDSLHYQAVTLRSAYVHDKRPLLSRFSRLKSFRVAANILWTLLYPDYGHNPFPRNFSGLFPATLEILHIIYAGQFILWEDFKGFVLNELKQVPKLRKIFIECDGFTPAPLEWKELREHARSEGVDLIALKIDQRMSENFLYERGWGMDGSIKWARCLEDLNIRDMPLVMPEENWEAELEADSKHFFYKWHLYHKGGYSRKRSEPEADDQTRGDQTMEDEAIIGVRPNPIPLNRYELFDPVLDFSS